MTSSKPRWLRPWSEEVSWQAQASKTVAALDKETFLTWLDGAGVQAANLSFGGVWMRSEFVAKWLLGDLGLAPGDRAMLVYSPGPEFFVAFVSCLRAGVLAVPNYPPDPSSLRRGLEKLDLVSTACESEVGLTDSVVHKLRVTTSIWHPWPGIRWHNTDGLSDDPRPSSLFHRLTSSRADLMRSTSFRHFVSNDEVPRPADAKPELVQVSHGSSLNEEDERASESLLDSKHTIARRRSQEPAHGRDGDQQKSSGHLDQAPHNSIALLQFTSGSTGDPKGVMISHRNIWHNVNEIYLPGQHNFLGTRIGEAAVARLHDLAEPSARVVAVSWLPQFHDSGLMLMLLGPFLAG